MQRNNHDTLPISVTPEIRENPHIMSGLAQRAFHLANYDMTPDNAVDTALRLGLIEIEKPMLPAKIKRMTGNGSFA